MGEDKNTTDCCCTNKSTCCGESSEVSKNHENRERLVIDFLYLDLDVCVRCQGAEKSLESAIDDVKHVLELAGIEVVVNKINVINEELAKKYHFVSSPTIRINGRDIQLEVHENTCQSCGDLCGDEVNCRVYVYKGQEYTVPPKEMIVEAILREAFGGKENHRAEEKQEKYVLPENLRRFYEGLKSKPKNYCC
ncbi:DUF2703 domain-containing protein [Carboxydothermus hydrogenoformans]|uniref:Uncharacterized protein n=1 Tax=Carboxydothermus hydrogenoformans (strain ATCC BAA-161 / DSM 6008 / Z-2901) TaxID=246194 RepID=Q3ABF4_CARHZ|nr:DUF2703 domain-containing protein [Carboxydothermus hydrogenoformans]ABB13970.1 hypothetical protein CHY_1710 [Carboxydothermus hydrogenoformans Z-2901]